MVDEPLTRHVARGQQRFARWLSFKPAHRAKSLQWSDFRREGHEAYGRMARGLEHQPLLIPLRGAGRGDRRSRWEGGATRTKARRARLPSPRPIPPPSRAPLLDFQRLGQRQARENPFSPARGEKPRDRVPDRFRPPAPPDPSPRSGEGGPAQPVGGAPDATTDLSTTSPIGGFEATATAGQSCRWHDFRREGHEGYARMARGHRHQSLPSPPLRGRKRFPGFRPSYGEA
jgi:hypothetical protein